MTPSAKDFHNAFPSQAKGGEDESQFYVQRSADDAHDAVAEMQQAIDWEEETGCYLFSGLRGVGKTTELNRLKITLEASGIVTFYCDASAYLDLTDPSIGQAELLLTALAGMSDEVNKRYDKTLLTDTIWERTKRLLNSNVELKPKITAGAAEIEFSLEENPDFRQELIKFARASGDFFQETQKYVADVAAKVKSQTGAEKIVLIVDSLERLSAPSGEEHVLFNSLKELFYNNPSRLAFADVTVIYTVPPHLHAVLPNIDSHFSGTFSLPNFKVLSKPEEGQDAARSQDGIDKMVAIVLKRYTMWDQILSRPVLEHLAWMSGGNVRRLFALLRHLAKKAVLNKVNFPVLEESDPSVTQAIAEEAKPLQWLNAEDRKWLSRCEKTSGNLAQYIEDLNKDLPPIIRLFDHSLVLNYQNGTVWYQVPPLVRTYVKTS